MKRRVLKKKLARARREITKLYKRHMWPLVRGTVNPEDVGSITVFSIEGYGEPWLMPKEPT